MFQRLARSFGLSKHSLQLMPCMDQEHTDHLDGVQGLHVQKSLVRLVLHVMCVPYLPTVVINICTIPWTHNSSTVSRK
jgi:hypothetical protein